MSQSPENNIVRQIRIRYLLLCDLCLILLAAFLAVEFRIENLSQTWAYIDRHWPFLLLVVVVRLPLYYWLNLYNRLWRYASINELRSIAVAGVVAPLVIALFNFGLFPLLGISHSPSRSIWLLEAIISLGALGVMRLALRMAQEYRHQAPRADPDAKPSEKTLIVGAGNAGALILREIERNPGSLLTVVGFIDDDPDKQKSSLQGVPVLGGRETIPTWVKRYGVDQIILAIPSAPGEEIRQIVQICESAGVRARIIPSLTSFLNGGVGLEQLRPIEIADLLRREPIVTDLSAVSILIQGRRVLVTGAGGSIGSEICRQVLQRLPSELILVGHGENSIFEVEHELAALAAKMGGATRLTPCIADIQNRERMQSVFAAHRPEIVFHAAAHKHVPLMEANPGEAIANNVLGTQSVLDAAQDHGVKTFVAISTDKAVNPSSIMGATKRVAELLVQDAARSSGRRYVAVRFGNVLGSRGSVVLTFKRQIAAGGPVTVTDPEVTRFFMTIPEAVQLVLQSAALGQGGEIFMLDMGKSVRILDLAKDMIRLSGLRPEQDIPIIFSGLRPGEKLAEELITNGECYQATAHPKCRLVVSPQLGRAEQLHAGVVALAHAVAHNQRGAMVEGLRHLVPEYQPGPKGTEAGDDGYGGALWPRPEKAPAHNEHTHHVEP